MKIITTIPNFDKNKSYPDLVKVKVKVNVKLVPLYPTKCPCHYGYLCDDPKFDYSKPLYYIEVSKDDDRNKLFDS